MLATASKYTNVSAAARQAAPLPGTRKRLRGGDRVASPAPRMPASSGALSILVPKRPMRRSMAEWLDYELRHGGRVHEYLRVERAMTERRWRALRAKMEGFRQNNRSEWRLLAAVPRRDFHRWQQTDPDFWRDDKNLKSLKRDNPDLPIYV